MPTAEQMCAKHCTLASCRKDPCIVFDAAGGTARPEPHIYEGPTYDGNGWVEICGRKTERGYCFKSPGHPIHAVGGTARPVEESP